jgi:hypothetical protein
MNVPAVLRLVAFKKGRGAREYNHASMSVSDHKGQHPDRMNFTDCGLCVIDGKSLGEALVEVLQQPLCTTLTETTTPPPNVATIEP